MCLLADLRREWRTLDWHVEAYDAGLAQRARSDDLTRRLAKMAGIGVLNATAMLAAVGDRAAFARGGDFAA